MSRRQLGLAAMALGLLMMVVGVVAMLGDSSDDTVTAAATTTSATPTTTQAPTTTIQTTTTSTTAAPTTTTAAPATSTTTTTAAPPSIEDFVAAYATATEGGDSAFLTARLLPELVDIFGEDLCQAWVDREILAISNYTLTGEATGPFSRNLNVGDTAIAVEQYYEAPVSFSFQGESFEAVATFAVRDGEVFWIGECR